MLSRSHTLRSVYALVVLSAVACSSKDTGGGEQPATDPQSVNGTIGPDGLPTGADGSTPPIDSYGLPVTGAANGPAQANAAVTTTTAAEGAVELGAPTGLPTFVLLSGNKSCRAVSKEKGIELRRHVMYEKMQRTLATVIQNTGVELEYVLTCYIPNSSDIMVYHSALPDQWQRLHESQLTGAIANLQPSLLFMAGHSYGGWLALQVASELSIERRMNGLFTIDAISPNACKGGFSRAGCRGFPNDFIPEELERIAAQTDVWSNYYQTAMLMLHSGPAPAAHYNHKFFVPHSRIDETDKTWDDITLVLISRLRPTP